MSRERRPRVDPRAVVARLGREGAELLDREVLAPLLPGGRIRTRLGGLVYELRPTSPFAGWGRFRPVSEREAAALGEALPWERAAYLELFPPLRALLLWPTGKPAGTWWALPYNESDARRRFRLSGEPAPVHLCDPLDGARAFERVLVRVDGRTLWYDGPDPLSDPEQAEWLRAASARGEAPDRYLPGLSGSQRLALLYARVRALDAEHREPRLRELNARRGNPREREEWLREQVRAGQLEGRLRHALAKADAQLHGYSEADGGLVVEWSERGQARRYRSLVNPDLTVVSSGICLSGRDRAFDLTSLVSVMGEQPEWMEMEGEEW